MSKLDRSHLPCALRKNDTSHNVFKTVPSPNCAWAGDALLTTGIVELKFLKHECHKSKYTTTGEQYDSAAEPCENSYLPEPTAITGGSKCTNHS